MAKMIGKNEWHPGCGYGCCVGKVDKHATKRQEEIKWRREYLEEEYEDHRHDDGMCRDEVTGMYGCEMCDPDFGPEGCPTCMGSGTVGEEKCRGCFGFGYIN